MEEDRKSQLSRPSLLSPSRLLEACPPLSLIPFFPPLFFSLVYLLPSSYSYILLETSCIFLEVNSRLPPSLNFTTTETYPNLYPLSCSSLPLPSYFLFVFLFIFFIFLFDANVNMEIECGDKSMDGSANERQLPSRTLRPQDATMETKNHIVRWLVSSSPLLSSPPFLPPLLSSLSLCSPPFFIFSFIER